MSNEELSGILSCNRDRIVGQWANITKTASVRYSEQPLDEIRQDLSVLFDGIVQYVRSGDRVQGDYSKGASFSVRLPKA
jgi:nicotinamide riboside kinase